ncbi:MAG: radical SAM protein [Planctomycetota bacterium]
MVSKAFLVVPPTGLYVREDRCQSSVADFSVEFFRPPHDLMMMAATLEHLTPKVECRIRDYPVEGGDLPTFTKDFLEFQPDMLVVSITTPTLDRDMEILAEAKRLKPSIITVAKGAHFLKEAKGVLEQYPQLDAAIRGENEVSIGEIATMERRDWGRILGLTWRSPRGVEENPDRPYVENLDEMPFPARHLIRNELYTRPDVGRPLAVLDTQRGCPARCVYCLVASVSGREIRTRSPESVVAEVEECVNRHGIRDFLFKADTFTWNKDWVIKTCQLIIEKKLDIAWICNSRVDTLCDERLTVMKKAGCYAIGFGIESINPEILKEIKKGASVRATHEAVRLCRKHKVKSYGYFMIGFPSDTEETVKESIEFSRKAGIDFIDFYIAYPFPGTEFEKMVKEKGLYETRADINAYSQPAIRTIALSSDRLAELRREAMRGFYTRPAYIMRKMMGIESFAQFKNYVKYGLSMLKKTAG